MRQTFSNKGLEAVGTAMIHGWRLVPTTGYRVRLRHRNTGRSVYVTPSGKVSRSN